MIDDKLISWLLEGDVSIQYQTYRDLWGVDKPQLRRRIEREGWGAKFLSFRKSNGHWGGAFYLPKWTSTHYTLLDLKYLCISPGNKTISETLKMVFEKEKGPDGGLNPLKSVKVSDVCVNGMALDYSSYFQVKEERLKSIVDFLLSEQMPDGGFNCHSNRKEKKPVHSSLHTTLSVVEGILEYERNGYTYRLSELPEVRHDSHEFILRHKLFRSHRTGGIIKSDFLRLSYPCRWRYDILKALDYFRLAEVKYDKRMNDAIDALLERRSEAGQWKCARHPGFTHFEMEKSGEPSRWNTLRALRVLKYFGKVG
ncbi:MAG TPA: hypothetical protein VLX91_14760 [Candidatus Acidoferrales bacterium]|nr:hypothetical protein [Candidatus Acidoferrales bacterium]